MVPVEGDILVYLLVVMEDRPSSCDTLTRIPGKCRTAVESERLNFFFLSRSFACMKSFSINFGALLCRFSNGRGYFLVAYSCS